MGSELYEIFKRDRTALYNARLPVEAIVATASDIRFPLLAQEQIWNEIRGQDTVLVPYNSYCGAAIFSDVVLQSLLERGWAIECAVFTANATFTGCLVGLVLPLIEPDIATPITASIAVRDSHLVQTSDLFIRKEVNMDFLHGF